MRIGLVVTASDTVICSRRRHYRQDLISATSFLTSLPGLVGKFSSQGSGQRSRIKWPAIDTGLEIDVQDAPASSLLNGLISGFEVSRSVLIVLLFELRVVLTADTQYASIPASAEKSAIFLGVAHSGIGVPHSPRPVYSDMSHRFRLIAPEAVYHYSHGICWGDSRRCKP